MRSLTSDAHSHEKAAKQLQRQSTITSRRNYYYGAKGERRASSASSTSSSDAKDKLRKHGARSKDSGIRSPDSFERTATPISARDAQIYSVSSKSRRGREGVASPTPSYGQRSVKTTTTTLAAGLDDRPHSRQTRASDKQRHDSWTRSSTRPKSSDGAKVSKPPSPFQKLTQFFAPSSQKAKSKQKA